MLSPHQRSFFVITIWRQGSYSWQLLEHIQHPKWRKNSSGFHPSKSVSYIEYFRSRLSVSKSLETSLGASLDIKGFDGIKSILCWQNQKVRKYSGSSKTSLATLTFWHIWLCMWPPIFESRLWRTSYFVLKTSTTQIFVQLFTNLKKTPLSRNFICFVYLLFMFCPLSL